MKSARSAPLSLKIVAGLFLLMGVSSLLDVLIGLAQGRYILNPAVLGLFVGVGLLRFHPIWRTVALVFVWLVLIGVPFAILALYVAVDQPLNVVVFGQPIDELPRDAATTLLGVLFLLAAWLYWVLTRPNVRVLFTKEPA